MADPLFKYTLPDYRFEWIDSYVNVIWFQSEQVPQSTEDGNVIVMEHSYNEYVEEEDQREVIVMIMKILMILVLCNLCCFETI